MNETTVIGLQMMGIGMGFVICFLCTLIIAMFLMSRVVGYLNTIFPEAVAEVNKVAKKVVEDDSAIAIAIAAVLAKSKKA